VVDEVQAVELFRFEDPVQSVTVEVRCDGPLLMGKERYYAAEIVVESGFISGRVGLQVSLEDLDEWERCLGALQAEEGVEWPAGGRSAWLEVVPDDPVEGRCTTRRRRRSPCVCRSMSAQSGCRRTGCGWPVSGRRPQARRGRQM
jgi:hypothetical protein